MTLQVPEGIEMSEFFARAPSICGIGPDALDYRVLLRCI